MIRVFHLAAISLLLTALVPSALRGEAPEADGSGSDNVSYHRDIRPIFQAYCHGCHQPAKQSGGYEMTEYERLVKGGESGQPAIVPGQPDASNLVTQIVPADGQAEMPKDKPPLDGTQIDLITKWINQGAANDAPASVSKRYDTDHPPEYSAPQIITSIDYSADGELLAVSGYHEVLIHKSDGSELVARLIGISERIEAAVFSPDSSKIAVTGGSPGRMGEVQIWDVAARQLVLSLSIGYDTLYGASWSPNGKVVAFGCPDNTVRAIDATTGEQLLFNGAHNDWVLDTIFSIEGTHVISVSRDRSLKLVEFATQRFIDNITSITPGALKGGLHAVARHPERDELVVGGADGTPKVFRMLRTSKRVIGDDANLIRRFSAMPGRLFDVAVSPDGKHVAAGSSHNGQGTVYVYRYEVDTNVPDDIRKISEKNVRSRSAAEKERIQKYQSEGASLFTEMQGQHGGVFAVRFSADSKVVASGGFDGVVRLNEAETGKLIKEFPPIHIESDESVPAVQ